MKIEVCKGQVGLALYVDDKRVDGPRHNGVMETVLSAEIPDRPTPSPSPVSAPSPAGGVREASEAFDKLIRYGARSNRDQSLQASDGTIFRFDDRSAFFLSDRDRDCIRAALTNGMDASFNAGLEAAAEYLLACDDYGDRHKADEIRKLNPSAALSSPATPDPVSAPANGEVVDEMREVLMQARRFVVFFLAFVGRDRGTERFEKTLDALTKLAVAADEEFLAKAAALSNPAPGHGEGGL